MVVGAQDLHCQPGGRDLGDGGGHEGFVSVLSHQLVALLVDHEHHPRRGERGDFLPGTSQGLGGQQEQGANESEEVRPHDARLCPPIRGRLTLPGRALRDRPFLGAGARKGLNARFVCRELRGRA